MRAQYIPPRQLGAAKSKLSAEDAALLARMQTNRQARAVLGVIAKYLQQGYQVAQTVPSFISPVDGTKMAAAAMKSALDQDNSYAMRVYATIPNDDAPLDPLVRKKIALVMTQTRSTLVIVSTEANDLNRGLTGALMDLFNELFKRLAHDAVQDPLKALKWVGVGLIALIGLFTLGKLVHTVVLGEAMDEELLVAEREAMQIARERRRLRSRTTSM